MTVIEEVLAALVAALSPAGPNVTGTLVDGAGIPLAGATVAAVHSGLFSGTVTADAVTDARGRFALLSTAPDSVLVVSAGGVVRTVPLPSTRPVDVGAVTLIAPITLSATVGVTGTNRPLDVRRLQARLHRLGRLSDAEVAAEPVDLAAAPPLRLGPHLLRAFTEHLVSRLGRLPATVELSPDDPLDVLLDADPPAPLASVLLAGPVGALPGDSAAAAINAAPQVAVVQQRLHQLGLLLASDLAAEDAGPSGSQPDPVVAAPATFDAVTRLARDLAGTSLTAVVPGTVVERVLRDPPAYGRRPVLLTASVGPGGSNLPHDVLAVQRRLLTLGHLSATNATAEQPAAAATGTPVEPVPDAALPQTFAALTAFRAARVGGPIALPIVEPLSPAIRRLNFPPRLEITGTVGWASAPAAQNSPADVRAIQDRLLLLRALTQPDYDAEKVHPHRSGRVDQADLVRTAAALAAVSSHRTPLRLSGPIGRGAGAARSDIRRVQDRLRGLNFLDVAAHAAERVDPGGSGAVPEASLAATYAALSSFRARLLNLPADDPAAAWTAQPIVRPGDETAQLLDDPLVAGRRPLNLRGSVGTSGWNFPDDVRAVQRRLRDAGLLSAADATAEAVPTSQVSRVGDLQLVQTRAAIRRFLTVFLAAPASAPERIEPASAEKRALDDPYGALVSALDPVASVGTGGVNRGIDVTAVQDRLVGLGYLTERDALDEAAPPLPAPVPAAALPATLAATAQYRRLMFGATDGLVSPLSESHWALCRPATPRAATLPFTAGVGRGAANRGGDVRLLQDRLLELGFLAPADYSRELVPPGGAAAVPAAGLAATLAAIVRVQQTLAGVPLRTPDGVVSLNGRAHRVLEAPAFGTPTTPNAVCDHTVAGPHVPNPPAAPLRVLRAIEHVEAGGATGEVPAVMRNASRMPASWGRSQVIGYTAIRTLNSPTAAPVRRFYGLTPARLTTLATLAGAVVAAFDAILASLPAAVSEADLQVRIDNRVLNFGDALRAATGLGALDTERMYRAAQLRRHLQALPAGTPATDLLDPALHPAASINITALGLTGSEVTTYRDNPLFIGEHRQGFVTLALFRTPEGQRLRQAMTDDSGTKLGKVLVVLTWNSTDGQGLTERERAQVTAYLHNRGGTVDWAVDHLAEVAAWGYVNRVITHWDGHP